MIVDYEVAKLLKGVGFSCKSFWVYMNGKRVHTGADGFDEGEFDFLKDNYLNPAIAEDLEQLKTNKGVYDEAYKQKEPEFVCAPENEDVIIWLDTFGIYIEVTMKNPNEWSFRISAKNCIISKIEDSRATATKEAIKESLEILKRQLKK
jgi:hypothetical protein